MDFVTVIFFQLLYYLRPQEWPIGLSSARFVLFTMLAGLASLSFRERGFNVRDVFRTPHDWAVLAFWLWIVFASPEKWETFKETLNLYIFYIVIVQTLYSVPRLNQYVGWWTFVICAVAGLALLSLYGFDPLESANITRGVMKDRLVLNLSIFNNPNALGHSVVPAIPLLYYFCIWKKPIALRVLGVALMAMVGYCIYLTVSKGAFLTGTAVTVATLTFGRPKTVQAMIVCGTLMFGGTALSVLPRMSELNKSKTDEAIQGRIMAFSHGRKVLTATGVGYRKWGESFLAAKYRFKRTKFDKESLKRPLPIVFKAPHSSYVCIGAELGYIGFFLHMGILYCGLRTLVSARTATPDEERVRRILFVLTVSYMVSSWMVNFEYRPTFFMFAAASAALHRHLLRIGAKKEPASVEEANRALPSIAPVWQMRLQPEHAPEGTFARSVSPVSALALEPQLATATIRPASPNILPTTGIASGWNRIGLLDLSAILAMTYAGIRFWDHLIKTM